MKKIVITGGAGFIGSALLRYLNDTGKTKIIVVDDLCKEKEKNLSNKKFIDLLSKNALFSFLERHIREIDQIVHLGACSDTLEKDISYLMKNNFYYSVRLATIAVQHQKRFIYASSAATYGKGEKGFQDSLLEELRPINMYAFSKQLFDLWAYKKGLLTKMVGLKYFNVFGPNEYHKKHMASMIFKMVEKAKKEKSISLYKSNTPKYLDGEQQRDFIYVKDAVKMTALFLEELQDISGIFNIGSGVATSWNQLAKALFAALKKEAMIRYIEMPNNLKAQYQNYTCADMRKLNRCCSIRCQSVEDAIQDYVRHYLLTKSVW